MEIPTLKLFKALPIKDKRRKKNNKEILKNTIKKGYIFSPEVMAQYNRKELEDFSKFIEKEIVVTSDQMNSSFHKSWNKIKNASMEQLVTEQILHYFTTYGFESLGIYNKDSVYFPSEQLDIPNVDVKNVPLVVIKGYTKKEIKSKLLNLLNSGIALNADTSQLCVDISDELELSNKDIEEIKNKEVKMMLCSELGLIPEQPQEFLRFIIYLITDKTLIIKSPGLISGLKEDNKVPVNSYFKKYEKQYGLEKLAMNFYRFKPIFLALRQSKQTKSIINKIRRLAKKYHKPMPQDYLNEVTAKINKGETIKSDKLVDELSRVNTFRKIRLAYALKFRTTDCDSIMYRLRNGKSFATKLSNKSNASIYNRVYKIVEQSIIEDLKKNVSGKKIYIPENVNYSLPATEKQFTGNIPSGTSVSVSKDMVFGIHWNNEQGNRIDLDLSLLNASGKIGWDSSYRTGERDILFSGDVTNAAGKNGASELFYVKRQTKRVDLMKVNYYNYDAYVPVTTKILVVQESPKNLSKNYMVDPNNVKAVATTKIDKKENIVGIIVTTTNEVKFYFIQTALGNMNSSSNKEYDGWAREFLAAYYSNSISLNKLLEKADAELIEDAEESDIDLSMKSLEKDTIIDLIMRKE